MSVEGFAAIGSQALSSVMKEAVNRYQLHKQALEKYDDGTLESFSASYEEAIFDDLDDMFFNECDKVDYVNYIKAHIADFGD